MHLQNLEKIFFIRYDSLYEDVSKFEELHLQLVGLINDTEVAEHDEVQDTFNDIQFEIKYIYKNLYEKSNIQIIEKSKSINDGIDADTAKGLGYQKLQFLNLTEILKNGQPFLTCTNL